MPTPRLMAWPGRIYRRGENRETADPPPSVRRRDPSRGTHPFASPNKSAPDQRGLRESDDMEESRTKMPKKRPADERSGGRAAKLSNRRRRRRHLYLVLDDWERGYSIRKLDLSSDDSDDFPMVGRTEQRLPPAVFRLEAPHALSGLFAAFGTKIIATHQTPRRTVFMWDVCTRALSFGPRHKFEPNSYCNIYVEVNGQLFLLDDASFECLSINDRKKDDIWEEFLPDCLQYLLRVKTFFLKYDRNGDLRAVVHGQVRSYRLPKRATGYCDHLERPVAFW
ncbi:hypothetical protein EJB05_21398, partial [Eragrostis curvula]